MNMKMKNKNKHYDLWKGGIDGIDGENEKPPINQTNPVTITRGIEEAAKFFANSNNAGSQESTLSVMVNNLLILLAAGGSLCLLSFIGLSIANLIILISAKNEEKSRLSRNKVIIRDTIEYSFLDYAKYDTTTNCNKLTQQNTNKNKKKIKTNNQFNLIFDNAATNLNTEKKLKLYPAIYVINFMIRFILMYVLIYLIIGCFLLFYYFKINDKNPALKKDLNIKFNKNVAIIMLSYSIIGAIAIALTTTLLKQNAIDKVLSKYNQRAYELKSKINLNLYVDAAYLDTLSSDNIDLIMSTIKDQMDTNPVAAKKMIFTYNVYKHYMNNFNGYDSLKEDFKKSFSVNSLKQTPGKGTFEPVEFLFYNDDYDAREFEDHFHDDIQERIKLSNDSRYEAILSAYINIKNSISLREDVRNKLKNVNDTAKFFKKSELDECYKVIFRVVFALFIFSIVIIVIIIFILMSIIPAVRIALTNAGTFIKGLFSRA